MTEYSVTRALAELKLLDKRINKEIERSTFATVKTKNKQLDVEKFNKEAVSQYQSITDLLTLRNKIKSAVVQNNATTRVKISGKEYTVAEAIERKNSLDYEKRLLQKLQTERTLAKNQIDQHEANVRSKLDRLLELEFGKDVRSNVGNVDPITNSYLENNKIEFVNPLNIDEKIKQLEAEIEGFEKDVDFALSESNAMTKISLK